MAKDIKAGVLLDLRDNFSKGIKTAGSAVGDFAVKSAAEFQKLDRILSGMPAKLGALGLGLSMGAATRDMIELDAAITAMGVQAGISNEEIAEMKRNLYDIAMAPDIKMDVKELEKAQAVIVDLTGDAQYADANLEAMGLAMRGTGSSGEAIGGLFTLFKQANISGAELNRTLGSMVAMANNGAFTAANLAALGPRIFSAYLATGRSAKQAFRDGTAALEVIRTGVGTSEQAATAFEALIRNLSDPQKIQKLGGWGVQFDLARESIGSIMARIVEATRGDAKKLYEVFDAEAVRSFNAAMAEYQASLQETGKGTVTSFARFERMAGDLATIRELAARNAGTMAANLTNLHTAFNRFAESNLGPVLENVTERLNNMAKNPAQFKAVFDAIKRGILGIAAIKLTSGILSFVASLRSLPSGGSIKLTQETKGGAGAAMPVYVTNWGGQPSFAGAPSAPAGGLVDQYGKPLANPIPPAASGAPAKGKWNLNKPNMKGALKAGAVSAALTAAVTIPGMVSDLNEISKDETMTDQEKTAAKGGAIGETVGSIGGALAGAAAGAALGSIIPGVGTVIGGIVGGLIGQFGGPAGRWLGEKIGAAAAGKIEEAEVKVPDTEAPEPEPLAAGAPVPSPEKWVGYADAAGNVRRINETATATAGAGSGELPAREVNDLIVTPQGRFSTHPQDYIFAMKNPASFMYPKQLFDSVKSFNGSTSQNAIVVEGKIELRSELTIDDKGYRLRQSVGKNTTPYKFATGNVKHARLIQ
jgi:hypothetical protein